MAKTETTVRGYVYTVTSPNGGTVTDAEGKLNKPVDAGDQVTVQAPSDSLTCDDDDAVIYKVNFNDAASVLRMLGGGAADPLPPGFLQAAFLESTGTQYINTEYHLTGDDDVAVDVAEVARPQFWGCVFGTLYDSGASYYLELKYYDENTRLVGKKNSANRYGYWAELGTTPSARNVFTCVGGQWACNGVNFGTKVPAATFTLGNPASLYSINSKGNVGWTPSKLRIYSFRVSRGRETRLNLVPALAPDGVPCLCDKTSGRVLKNNGSGHFVLGMTFGQASKLGMALPDGGGDLYISLPAGWEQNSKVHASLSRAAVRLWNIYPRTTPAATSTSTTFALRRLWVRKIADEHGTYVAADGSRWLVEWSEEVFSSSTPEDLGFERFRSVESAVAYWELQSYVDPEAMDELMGDNGTLEQGDTENTSPATNS
jgi:hypothetical protein